MSALCAALKCQTSLLHRLENPLGVFYKLGYYHTDYWIIPDQVSTSLYKFLQILQVSTIYQSTPVLYSLHNDLFST